MHETWMLSKPTALDQPAEEHDPPLELRVHELTRMVGANRSRTVIKSLKYLGYKAKTSSSKVVMERIERDAFIAYYRKKEECTNSKP